MSAPQETAMHAAIAANRFGLGAGPGELSAIGSEPKTYLLAQLEGADAFRLRSRRLPSRAEAAAALALSRSRKKAKKAGQPAKGPDPVRTLARTEAAARFQHGRVSQRPFAERLALFWANHLTVSASRKAVLAYAGLYEREAIRPSLQGSFADLLLASAFHPAMLIYLDQARSVGPGSPGGIRRESGLNENFAREVMELHSLGVQGGYGQQDVRELALALTGWTLRSARTRRMNPGPLGETIFVDALHEPGRRTVLGRVFADTGADQGPTILRHLAQHPATARHIATRMARHFSADRPAPALVDGLAACFVETQGHLPSLHRALVASPALWDVEATKIKSPHELLTSACRALNLDLPEQTVWQALSHMGQAPFHAESPEGWPDDAAHWMGPDALYRRLQVAESLSAKQAGAIRPEALAEAALGPQLGDHTRLALQQADSQEQAITLLLMSPEFQRR